MADLSNVSPTNNLSSINNSFSLEKGFTIALSKLYEEVKDFNIDDKIRLYVKENRLFLKNPNKEILNFGQSRLKRKHLIKKLTEDKTSTTAEIKRKAGQALLLLYRSQPSKCKEIVKIMPAVIGSISITERERFQKLFENPITIGRSNIGGNGVYFVRSDSVHEEVIVVKFVEDSTPIMGADILFQRAGGFVTPQTRAVHRSSELGNIVAEKFSKWLDDKPLLKEELQVKNFLAGKGDVLFMQLVPGIDLKTMLEGDILGLVKNPEFGKTLGRMIVLDMLIGNPDRMSTVRCNLGNIMVDISEKEEIVIRMPNSIGERTLLGVIDHEVELIDPADKFARKQDNKPELAAKRLAELKSKKAIKEVVNQFRESLYRNREDAGSVEITDEDAEILLKAITEGVEKMLNDVDDLVNSPGLANELFLMDPEKGSKILTLIIRVLESVKQLNRR